jgi:hypothetical protein
MAVSSLIYPQRTWYQNLEHLVLVLGVFVGMTLVVIGNSTATFECRAHSDLAFYPHVDPTRRDHILNHSTQHPTTVFGSWLGDTCHSGECVITSPEWFGWRRRHVNVPLVDIDAIELDESFATRFDSPNEKMTRVVLSSRLGRLPIYTEFSYVL